jgi:two-component system nitrogen regulation sensor histidine kinase NtrY
MRRVLEFLTGKGRSWLIRSVLFFAALLLLSRGVEEIYLRYAEKNWESLEQDRSTEYLSVAAREFSGIQRSTRRLAVEVGGNPAVQSYLSGRARDRFALFEQISRISREQEVGVEVYDRFANLVAWEGRSGPPLRAEVRVALEGRMTSSVVRTQSSSQLFIVTPVRQDGMITGAVLLRRTIEVTYPFSNRFINAEGLGDQLGKQLGVNVEFNFAESGEPRRDGRYASAVLFGIDSSKVGVVSIMRPGRGAYLEGVAAIFQALQAGLIIALMGLIAFAAWRYVETIPLAVVRIAAVSVLVWLVRYSLLWLDIPSSLPVGELFEPSGFASKFGSGLAKSIGELTVTMVAVAVNTAYVVRTLVALRVSRVHLSHHPSRLVCLLISLVATVLIFWALRGFGAVIRSAVFDSSLEYGDPRLIFPTVGLALMIFNLMVLGACLIAAATSSLLLIISLFEPSGGEPAKSNDAWILLTGLFAIAAVLFDVVQESPLMSTIYRLSFGAGLLVLTWYLVRCIRRGKPALGRTNLLLTLGISALILYPLLEENTRENDRRRIEALAQDVLRPVDSWFSLVVQDALHSFGTGETASILMAGDSTEIQRLAVTRWAQSWACREGYTSIFTLFDPLGNALSRFAIGGQVGQAGEVDTALFHDNVMEVTERDIGRGINALKVYAGITDIRSEDGRVLGIGRVTIAAGQQTLFRGETPQFMRGATKANLQSFYRPVTVSEFRDGRLLPSGAGVFPIGYSLPESVARVPQSSFPIYVWADETLESGSYTTLFIRREGNGNETIGLSLRKPGLSDYLIGIVKVLIHFALLATAVLAAFFAVDLVRGRRYLLTFRGRLLLAFIVTAVVPLALLSFYLRFDARERLLEESARTLDEQTGEVAGYLSDQGRESALSAVDIAADVNTDFNLYLDSLLTATSRPELYDAGILDRRMSGSAYASVLLRGNRFHLETERIGKLQYAVGYRPLVDSAGTMTGVISVPALFRQYRLEEEVARRNAFVFGVYALVLLALLGIATTLANRIAAPLQQLKEATTRVARGDLDVALHVQGADGELKELIDSFGAMTRDLKQSREELIRFERELAWKEMAKQVAHEIKNPLTPMRLSIQHLRQTYRDKARDFDQILDNVTRTVIDQIDTLSRIASEFSHFARMPRRQLGECNVNEVLRESVRLFAQDAGIGFDVSTDETVRPLTADREELRRAFINIVRNGIQAMDGQGKIVITTEQMETAVRISIRDFGKGIPEEVKEKLFQPNFSTKTDGMGMGLAIVKKTIDDLGGTVTISRAPHKGTVVSIELPVA